MTIEQIQTLIDQSHHIIFLTGAGVSTLSGIPDYRSKNGLYQQNQQLSPEFLLSHTAFVQMPELQYQFMKDNMYFPDAVPNIVHQKMAEMAQQNRAKIITQNVDGLHTKAHTPADNLIEFHGSLYRIYAPRTNKTDTVEHYLMNNKNADGDWLRPAITFYEETPFDVEKSIDWVGKADLIIIVGTSFRVYPFASLLTYKRANTPIVVINQEPLTQLPANVLQIIADAGEIFEQIKTE